MNGEDLLKAMSQVDEQYVQEAETAKISKQKHLWVPRAAAAAACLAVVLSVGFAMGGKSAKDISMENAPAGMDRAPEMNAPILMDQETIACTEGISFPENTHDEVHSEPAAEPDTAAPEQTPGEAEMMPVAMARIEKWLDNGVETTVIKFHPMYGYSEGEIFVAEFQDGFLFVTKWDGKRGWTEFRKPTEEDFPVGSIVQLHISVEDDGTIYLYGMGDVS